MTCLATSSSTGSRTASRSALRTKAFGGLQPTIVFDLTDKPKAGKLPLHIDVNPTDRDQDEELERLLAVGAKPADVGQTGEESWHVLADPEGNEFCLLRRRLGG